MRNPDSSACSRRPLSPRLSGAVPSGNGGLWDLLGLVAVQPQADLCPVLFPLQKLPPPPFPTSFPRPPAFPHLPRRLVRRSVLSRLGALTSPPSPQSALLTPTISLNVTPSGKPGGGRRRVKSLPLQRCLHPNPEKLHMLLTGCAKVADGLKAADQLTLK